MKVKSGMENAWENGGWLKVVALRSKEAPNMLPLDDFRDSIQGWTTIYWRIEEITGMAAGLLKIQGLYH